MSNANNVYSLDQRRSMLANVRTNRISGGSGSIPLTDGSPNSTSLTLYPTCSGVQYYMAIRIHGRIKNYGANIANRSEYGAANLIRLLAYTDTKGQQRTNIDGRGLELLNLARQAEPVGAQRAVSANYGINFVDAGADTMPATIAAGATATFSHTFVLPFAYSAFDARGAIVAFEAGSNQTLNISLPDRSTAFVAHTANAIHALYSSDVVNMRFESLNYEVVTATKNLNLPVDSRGQLALPYEDFAYQYILNGGSRSGLVQGSDFVVPYDAGKTYFNTFAIFDNGGVLNKNTDVDSLTIQQAGSQDIHRLSSVMHNWESQIALSCGLPNGTYYQSHLTNPLNIINTGGSADFIIKPSLVNQNAALYTYNDYIVVGDMRVI